MVTYVQTKLESYLSRPVEVATLAYPELISVVAARYLCIAGKRAAKAVEQFSVPDTWQLYLAAKQIRDDSQQLAS